MGGSQLGQVMSTVSKYARSRGPMVLSTDGFALSFLRDPVQHASLSEKIEQQANARYGSARLWDDGIIMPQDTRDVVGLGLALAARSPSRIGAAGFGGGGGWDGSSFGVFRM